MTGCVNVTAAKAYFDQLGDEIQLAEDYAEQALTLIYDMKRDIRDGMLETSAHRLNTRQTTLQWVVGQLTECTDKTLMRACVGFEQAMRGELETEEEAEA